MGSTTRHLNRESGFLRIADRTKPLCGEAQDFAGEPVARIHLPVRVPLGFHGSWIADS
jgi:carotenoid cleavage dioxygenase-like enzyme